MILTHIITIDEKIHFISSHRIASHRIASHRTAPHRTAPHRTASRCVALIILKHIVNITKIFELK